MKLTAIFTSLILILSFSDSFAQFRVSIDEMDNSQISKEIDVRLTPEMFFPDEDIVFQNRGTFNSALSHRDLIDVDNKPTLFILHFGAGILRNRLNFDFHGAGNFPISVTDYNNAIRRQMFEAEPTSQQRRNSLFPFN